jgi:hypothetical protein
MGNVIDLKTRRRREGVRAHAQRVRIELMTGRQSSAEANALRTLADQIDAGKRELSPHMAKALARELAEERAEEDESLSTEEWEQAWATEIDRRLERHRTGQSTAHDLGEVLEGLRANR